MSHPKNTSWSKNHPKNKTGSFPGIPGAIQDGTRLFQVSNPKNQKKSNPKKYYQLLQKWPLDQPPKKYDDDRYQWNMRV